jgi:hypothetical protein
MSLIKGFDRIFLLIAIVSIIPAGLISYEVGREILKEKRIEYKEYVKKIQLDIENELKVLSEDEIKSKARYYVENREDSIEKMVFSEIWEKDPKSVILKHRLKELMIKAPVQYKYPSTFVLATISIFSGLTQAGILYFVLKNTTRLIKWVVDGFKEQK